ncbi:heme-binding protein [Microbacterium sp. LRZ72]|uniref:GlcG/HbpS family heme-binding protein n=1 Tax=Microbacterium sp. LRZ72 TaxID=2942481 RepID=UPI0029BE3FE6|nr:heme-binding protein [Microbacterium sp. LRZ72]MDX2377513.1 heme-binding protein [Microbacterium sp. LRZ72]
MANVMQEDAEKIMAIAEREALRIGKGLSIAVVDSGGFIVSIRRFDGARPMTPLIALSKAYTSAVMQRPSGMLKPWSNSDPVFFSQVATMGNFPIVATGGGVTLKRDGEFVGGVGVSGGTPQEDEELAQAVIAELGYDTDFAEWAGAKGAADGKH